MHHSPARHLGSILLVILTGCAGNERAGEALDEQTDQRVGGAERREASGTERTGDRPREPAPGEPVFEIGLSPGEGIPVIHATGSELALRRTPRVTAPVSSTVRVQQGQPLTWDSARYQTIEATVVRVRAPARLAGRVVGDRRFLSREQYYSRLPDTVVALNPPATLEYLQDRAEGSCFVRLQSWVIDASTCPVHDATRFESTGQPRTRWWIHVTGSGDRSGWVQVSDSTARVVRRTF